MDLREDRSVPLLLRFAESVPAMSAGYRYDATRQVNVVTNADGTISPAVEGPEAAVLTKTLTKAPGPGED
jgi:putative ATP-grasp target RiPP